MGKKELAWHPFSVQWPVPMWPVLLEWRVRITRKISLCRMGGTGREASACTPGWGGTLGLPQPTRHHSTLITADDRRFYSFISSSLRGGHRAVWMCGECQGLSVGSCPWEILAQTTRKWFLSLLFPSLPPMLHKNLEPGVLGKKNKKPSPALDSTVNLLFTTSALIYELHEYLTLHIWSQVTPTLQPQILLPSTHSNKFIL